MNPMDRISEHFCRRMYKYTTRNPPGRSCETYPYPSRRTIGLFISPLSNPPLLFGLSFIFTTCATTSYSVLLLLIQSNPSPDPPRSSNRFPITTLHTMRLPFPVPSLKRISSVFCRVSCYDYTCGSYYMLWRPLSFAASLSVSLCFSVFAKRRVFIG